MKLHIHDLMENIEDSSVQIEETDVVSSDRIKELTKMKLNMTETNTNHRGKKRALTVGIAAAVVAALGIASYAAFSGGLGNVLLNPDDADKPVQTTSATQAPAPDGSDGSDETAEYYFVNEFTMISLQGYSDSPEYKAAQEWSAFEDNYDTDWKILDQVGNKPTQWDDKYGAYGVYSQEMADKIDEIVSKYSLTLHGACLDGPQEKIDTKFGKIMDDANYAGYYYEDGTFSVDGDFGKYDFQLRRTTKGVLDTVTLNIGNINNFEQWEYTTASGVTVSLALSDGDQAIILADLDDSFVAVNVLLWMGEDDKPDTMTRADLENMADHIHFEVM
ncbi:hypothetical protein SAMN02910456_02241 [Ruminococcaceae bacterium YRB3002]|nr:hypothetical protein SAMN02910456_02241 [Ruminococcaceae bacterium YRB3002]